MARKAKEISNNNVSQNAISDTPEVNVHEMAENEGQEVVKSPETQLFKPQNSEPRKVFQLGGVQSEHSGLKIENAKFQL